MALSRIEGHDELYVGGLWALRRSDSLLDRGITHVLSLIAFNPASLRNFKGEPWTEYGRELRHLEMDVDDVDETDLLVCLPRAVRFIDEGLGAGGAVLVHCAAGKSRSIAATVAYLLWKYPNRFDPRLVPPGSYELASRSGPVLDAPTDARGRKETAREAVAAALSLVRRTRPMAEPNDGFMQQLALWWEMGCPDDVEAHPVYQRWAYWREVEESAAVGQAPGRLRFEDEQQATAPSGLSLRCKRCRRTLATAPFILAHEAAACPHYFVEPLSWMRAELQRGALSGRLACPNERCGAGVGRYDWRGIRCACGAWVTPGLSLQRARVDEDTSRLPAAATGADEHAAAEATRKRMRMLGIRMPPAGDGAGRGNL